MRTATVSVEVTTYAVESCDKGPDYCAKNGLDGNRILMDGLTVIDAGGSLTLLGSQFVLDDEGRKVLDGDRYMREPFRATVKEMPPMVSDAKGHLILNRSYYPAAN